MSALISPQTRICFDIVLFLNYGLSAIQPSSTFFAKSYFSSVLFLTIQFTQLSSTLRKWPVQGTDTSTTVGLSSARPLGRGQLTNTVSQARTSSPFSNWFIFLQFMVGCKPGLCRVGHKWVQVKNVFLNFKLLWGECKVMSSAWDTWSQHVTQAEPSRAEHWPAGLLVRLRQSAWYTLGQPGFLQETSCPPSPQLKHSSSRSFITSACDLRFICGRLFSFLDFSSVRLGWLCGWDNIS